MSDADIISPGLRNEIEGIRARQSIVRIDMDLLRELIELREFREKHPLPPAAGPDAKPKSNVVRVLEAHAVFGEYLDREAARLERKLQALDAGTFDAIAQTDADERARNDVIGRRAVEIMEQAHV
jgi:hypothetical protein